MKTPTNPSERAQTQSRVAREPVILDDRLALSVSELAAALGKSPTYVYRAIYAGRLRPVSNAGRLLISRREIEGFLSHSEPYNPKPKDKRNSNQEEVVA